MLAMLKSVIILIMQLTMAPFGHGTSNNRSTLSIHVYELIYYQEVFEALEITYGD